MKQSRRSRRMQIHHSRKNDRNASLNMVSLMDIFTILVFFLLVNATSAEVLPTPQKVTLPDSISERIPLKTLVITVNSEHISLQGQHIMNVQQALESELKTIKPLFEALKKQALESRHIANRQAVTIMADKQIPYALLKKIMLTCAGAEFTNLSFAVNQKSTAHES